MSNLNGLPSFESYGKYSSENYGVNTLKIWLPDITIWFSYRTPVAFHTCQTGLVVRENDWSTTTGKHLNWIDGGPAAGAHKKRIPGAEFEKRLAKLVK